MKYLCGHLGCDICGHHFGRYDHSARGVRYGKEEFTVCDSCIGWSVNHAYDAVCRLGGTTIDYQKPCPDIKPAKASSPSSGR